MNRRINIHRMSCFQQNDGSNVISQALYLLYAHSTTMCIQKRQGLCTLQQYKDAFFSFLPSSLVLPPPHFLSPADAPA